MKKIGVLALQGAFVEHVSVLNRLGVGTSLVRLPQDLDGLDGLVIPGGESTTIGKLMKAYELTPVLKKLIAEGLPVFGTCAGMILLAKQTADLNDYSLGAVDIRVRRNAFGRQVDSFETELSIPVLGETPFHAVFIRAPWIEKVGDGVKVLAQLSDGTPVAVRSKNVLVAAFHPELTRDMRFHAYFLNMVNK
ncbi:MAG: pyridoxal 5'-phosphate synthase glutaminase subunit PdxT [Nitrospiraceae bacterium]|nr:pyridoxal 5'-phosphate synthase glutaminase subunit PdxT [Nitrospiraceae bacterium]